MRPNRSAIAGAVALLFAIAGCGGGFSSGEEDDAGADGKVEEVRFGALLTLTGALSDVGSRLQKTVDFAVEEINADGGIKSLGGAKLKPVIGDSQTDPSAGVGETQRLIGDGVVAIIDQYPSAITIAASTVAERERTPFIAAISYADDITSRDYKYVFQQQVRADGIAEEKVQFLDALNEAADKPFERIGVVYENTDYGTSIARNLVRQLKDTGKYSVVADISYPAASPSFDAQAAKLRAAKPDLVFLVPYLNDQIVWQETADRFKLTEGTPWVGNSLKLETGFQKAVGEIPEGELDRNIWDADLSDESQELADRFKKATGFELSGNYALMYQAVHTLAAALEQAGSTRREDIREALADLRLEPGENMIMPWDALDFDDAGLNASGHGIVSQHIDGDWKTVWPSDRASTELQIDPAWTGAGAK